MMKHLIRALILVCIPILAVAQQVRWNAWTAGEHVTTVADGGSVVWAGMTNGLAKVDKATGVVTHYGT